MASKIDRTVDLAKFIDSKNVNSKYLYGTLIVYGDLTIKNTDTNITCKADRIWVRGKLTIQNCNGEISLPIGEIDAETVEIVMAPAIKNYPKKIIADTVILNSVAGGQSLANCDIYAATYHTDNSDLRLDPEQVFGLVTHTGEDGSMRARLINHQGISFWEASSNHLMSLKEHGYLTDINDVKEVQSFCIEAEILPKGSKVFIYADAKRAWDGADNNSVKTSYGASFSASN